MGTRGYIVVRYRGRYYKRFNHYDSYPSWLGKVLIHCIQKGIVDSDAIWNDIVSVLDKHDDHDLFEEDPFCDVECGQDIEWIYTVDLDFFKFTIENKTDTVSCCFSQLLFKDDLYLEDHDITLYFVDPVDDSVDSVDSVDESVDSVDESVDSDDSDDPINCVLSEYFDTFDSNVFSKIDKEIQSMFIDIRYDYPELCREFPILCKRYHRLFLFQSFMISFHDSLYDLVHDLNANMVVIWIKLIHIYMNF